MNLVKLKFKILLISQHWSKFIIFDLSFLFFDFKLHLLIDAHFLILQVALYVR